MLFALLYSLLRLPLECGVAGYRDSSSCMGLIEAMNTPPVSKIVRSPEFAGDTVGWAEVSLCPFTILAKAIVPRKGVGF